MTNGKNVEIEAMTIPNITTEFDVTALEEEEKEFLKEERMQLS